jgi:hypothetical protein
MSGCILAIDPGMSGAWAALDEDGALLSAGDLPTAGDGSQRRIDGPTFARLLSLWNPHVVIIEDTSARPGQGVSSMFRFGRAVGYLEGIVLGSGFALERVTPQKWKRWANLIGKTSGSGEPSRQKAIELFPSKSADFFSRKKDHNRAEAALIGLWFIRNSERIAA